VVKEDPEKQHRNKYSVSPSRKAHKKELNKAILNDKNFRGDKIVLKKEN
jgi:hypothetical protein